MIEENDPIAEQLNSSWGSHEELWPPTMSKEEWAIYLKVKTVLERMAAEKVHSANDRFEKMNKLSNEAAQADYDSIDFFDDQTPEVLDFVKALGFDPETLKSLDIHIESGQPVVCNAQVLPVAQRRVGSVWRSA